MDLKRFKNGALLLVASMLAAVGITPLANAAPSGTETSVRTDSTNDTLTITADTDLTGHKFTAVELAKIIDATAVNGKITETAVTTNSGLASSINDAAKQAGVTSSDLTGDPMTWVAKTLTDSDTSPYAGKLRDFITKLSTYYTIIGAATIPLTVNGKTAVLTGEPGVYLVYDKSNGAASLPILAATTISHMTNEKGTLGAVDWKALTAPAPEKSLTGINGKAPADPHKGTVNIGDTLTYKISQPVPATTGYENYKLVMTDHMPKELTALTDLTVSIDGDNLISDTGYTSTYSDEADGSHMLTITLGGRNTDALPVIKGHKTVTITYNVTVNGNARRNTSIENTATTGYSNNPANWSQTGTISTPTPVTVYTGGFTIKKTDRRGNPLKGAEFNVLDGTTVMKFTKQSDGVYTPDDKGSSTVTSDDNGLIKIEGIADKQINVKETKSPYRDSQKLLPSFGATVKVDAATGKTALIQTAETDDYGLVTVPTSSEPDVVTVMNVQSMFQLPRTGRVGMLLMTVPLTIMLMTGILLTVRVRRN